MAKMKIPKSIGACADLLFDTRERRLAAQKQVEAIQAEETVIKEYIINNLKKGDDTGGIGKHHQCQVYNDTVPRIEDPDKLFSYIKRTGSFDLLQRRLNDAAVKERWDDKKKIPGVGSVNIVKISLTKKKGK